MLPRNRSCVTNSTTRDAVRKRPRRRNVRCCCFLVCSLVIIFYYHTLFVNGITHLCSLVCLFAQCSNPHVAVAVLKPRESFDALRMRRQRCVSVCMFVCSCVVCCALCSLACVLACLFHCLSQRRLTGMYVCVFVVCGVDKPLQAALDASLRDIAVKVQCLCVVWSCGCLRLCSDCHFFSLSHCVCRLFFCMIIVTNRVCVSVCLLCRRISGWLTWSMPKLRWRGRHLLSEQTAAPRNGDRGMYGCFGCG